MKGSNVAADPHVGTWRRKPAAGSAMIWVAVTVIVNGTIVAGVAPARLVEGHVMAPLTPVVAGLASRVTVDPSGTRVTIQRGAWRVVVPVAYSENATPFVALAPVVDRLGGRARFDPRSRTLTVELPQAPPVGTPAPFDPGQHQVDPSPVFPPVPPPATPRAPVSGMPRPRRTAIPVTPSQPIAPASEDPATTAPRRPEF